MESEPPLPYHLLLECIFLIGNIGQLALIVVLLLFLILCSALISGSEVAYFSLNPNDLEDLKEESGANSDRILGLLEKPKKLLATILVFNNLINISIVILSYFIFSIWIPDEMVLAWAESINQYVGLSVGFLRSVLEFLLTTFVASFILVLFGEVIPKIYAKVNNKGFAKFMSLPLTYLLISISPISSLLIRLTDVVEKKIEPFQASTDKTEIDRAIDLAMTNDQETQENADILKGIVKFGDVSVKQIMKSRVDVTALNIETAFDELMDIVKESGYSRIPVYNEDFDTIAGILYVKDLLAYLKQGPNFNWQSLIRESVLYVPESKKIDELLREFQKERMHMAIVVDEYGGSSGIVTLEDVLEEVIGDIKDEFDQEEVDYVKIDDHNYIFEGKTLLNDVCKIIGEPVEIFDDVKGDADSLAGIMLEKVGAIPKSGKIIPFKHFTFRILAATDRRIERIKITIE